MQIKYTKVSILTALCALACLAVNARAGVVVVVSAKSPATSLTTEQVSQLFLGKSKSLPGAGDVTLIDQTEGSATRDAFYTKATGKNAAQVKALWSRLIFSGAAQPPTSASSGAEVKRMVGRNPSAIGYIDSAEVDVNVKVLLELD